MPTSTWDRSGNLDPISSANVRVILVAVFNREHHKKACHTLCGCLSDLRLVLGEPRVLGYYPFHSNTNFMVRNVKFPVSILPSIRIVQVFPQFYQFGCCGNFNGSNGALPRKYLLATKSYKYYGFVALVMLFLGLFSATITSLIPITIWQSDKCCVCYSSFQESFMSLKCTPFQNLILYLTC